MNTDDNNQEVRYRILKLLSERSDFTQRDMAGEMGISLAKVNYCLAELAKKGFIKVNRFKDSGNKLQYLYVLTPLGLEQKAVITLRFLKRKMKEYEQIKKEIEGLSLEIHESEKRSGFHRDLSRDTRILKPDTRTLNPEP